jgi:hypothetical protein
VYCGGVSSTADHVFARQFFLEEHRSDLPQVPSCLQCNNEKSKHEHYLATLLPFGGRHRHARKILTQMVPPRLAKNQKLHATLRTDMHQGWSNERGVFVRTSGVPVNPERLLSLIRFIVKGLIWHHWEVRLEPADRVDVHALAAGGVEYFDRIFARNVADRVRANLGQGTFVYVGVRGVDCERVTAWRMAGYGGMQFADPSVPGETVSVFGALTGPEREPSSMSTDVEVLLASGARQEGWPDRTTRA